MHNFTKKCEKRRIKQKNKPSSIIFPLLLGAFLQGIIGEKSKVKGQKSKVESLRSKVESLRSKVESLRSKVKGRKSKV